MSKGLSQKDGQDLLDLFHNLHAVSRLTTPVSLPTYISIHNAMTKEKNVGLTEFIEHFPQDYFGVDSGLKPFKGVHFNILERIAEVCYFADPAFFCTKYVHLTDEFGERVIGDFSSSECFRLLCEQVKLDPTLPVGSVPLCIAISLDETTCNSSMSRSETPLTFMIYNQSGDTLRGAFGCEFGGYAPSQPDSKPRLDAVLRGQGCRHKYKQKDAIKEAEYQSLLNFLGQFLTPLKECQPRGFMLQIGNSEGSFTINAVPFVVAIIGDNAGSSHIAGVSCSSRRSRCRICTKEDCSTFNLSTDPTDFESTQNFRSDADTITLAQERAEIERKRFRNEALQENDRAKLREASVRNVASVSANPLHEIFKVTSNAPVNLCSRFGLHHALPPDYLHTFLKGCMEYCIGCVMSILYAVQTLDVSYVDNVSTLDGRIESANIDQTLPATRMSKFHGGISKFFSAANSKKTRSTGIMTGGLPAWKLKPLLILLQICIGEDETILPRDPNWFRRTTFKHKTLVYSQPWSILAIVHHAMSSTLEVHFALSKKQATISDLHRMDYLIQLNILHLLRMKKLSNELLSNTRGKLDLEQKKPIYAGIKFHMMTHFSYYKWFFGCPLFLTDMELPEHSHLKTKMAFERTSKTFTDNISEMAIHQARCKHAERMQHRVLSNIPQELIKQSTENRGIYVGEREARQGFEFQKSRKFGFSTYDSLLFEGDKFSYAPKSTQCGLHTLVSLTTLQTYLFHYSLSEDDAAKALRALFNKCDRFSYQCRLLHNLRVSENDTLPLDKFYLHANQKKMHSTNVKGAASRSPCFSFFEAEYNTEPDKSIVVVRLMAIFEIFMELIENPDACGTHQLAVVCKMELVKKDRNSVIPEPFVKLKYGLDSRRCLDLDVIEFTSLHMPACVYDCCANPTIEAATNFNRCIFYQIPSSRMVMTKPVGSLEEMLGLSGADSMILQVDELNSELAHYNSLSDDNDETFNEDFDEDGVDLDAFSIQNIDVDDSEEPT